MKKIALVFMVLLLFVGTSSAQKGAMKIEPSLVIAFPHSGTNVGFGVNGTFFYGINKNIDLTGSLGYITWSYSDWDGNLSTIPVLFGGRYSFGDQSGFTPYASAELGVHFMSYSTEIPASAWTPAQTFSSSSTEFGLGIGGGAYYQIGSVVLDANLQYNSMDGSFFSVELGALFRI
jgi:opacity protein-like surface antigen